MKKSKKLQRDLKAIEVERTRIEQSPHYKMLNIRYIDERESNFILEKRIERKTAYIRKLHLRLDIMIFVTICMSVITILG
jgi:hypothetical protein